ncbi:hypothetical protein CDAR_45781 [Caerostris darwini]|uniref:Uncharacterized protein n=1 Tax=Caerostris darwini TaxID=1538125 RepID=A0AAV4W428_9ARAC|nr:hypothetical protein CDAR_45781 [Caerostris darwini]
MVTCGPFLFQPWGDGGDNPSHRDAGERLLRIFGSGYFLLEGKGNIDPTLVREDARDDDVIELGCSPPSDLGVREGRP